MKRCILLLILLFSTSCATLKNVQNEIELAQDNGFARVPQTAKELHWAPEDLPIQIVVHPTGGPWIQHIQRAADVANKRLGFEAFKVSQDLHPEAAIYAENSPGIVPVFGFIPDEGCPDVDLHCFPTTHWSAEKETGHLLATPILLPLDEGFLLHPDAYFLVVHELGHVLGLEHDPKGLDGFPWSIMEPIATLPYLGRTTFTDGDVARIRAWYLQKLFPEIQK